MPSSCDLATTAWRWLAERFAEMNGAADAGDAPPPSAPAADEDAVDAIEVTEAELRRIWADEAGREPGDFDVEAAFDALDDLLEAGYELRPPEQQAGFGEIGEAA